MAAPLRIGFLLSGTGRTLENLAAFLGEHPGLAEIVSVISDREGALGLERAQNLGIPQQVLACRRKHVESDSMAIFDSLAASGAELVVLGGFLKLLHIPPSWSQRVINVHPSLIPKFSGSGYYGDRVHRAVLEAGESESGCTIHFVDNIYDHGPVLLQERVPVLPDDTVDTLAHRVFEAECRSYPRAIEVIARGHLEWRDGQPVIQQP